MPLEKLVLFKLAIDFLQNLNGSMLLLALQSLENTTFTEGERNTHGMDNTPERVSAGLKAINLQTSSKEKGTMAE